jgi:hypothetical protein
VCSGIREDGTDSWSKKEENGGPCGLASLLATLVGQLPRCLWPLSHAVIVRHILFSLSRISWKMEESGQASATAGWGGTTPVIIR